MSKSIERISTNNFSVVVDETEDQIRLCQAIVHPAIHTAQLPETHDFLEQNLASIFENQCFNYAKRPFAEEVKSTEIGHLLEHLILEFMKVEAEKEFGNVSFRGETVWDWKNDPRGTYWINIKSRKPWRKYFPVALDQAVKMLDELYNAHYQANSKPASVLS